MNLRGLIFPYNVYTMDHSIQYSGIVEKAALAWESLTRGDDVRNSAEADALLALLWQKDPVTLCVARITLVTPRALSGMTLTTERWAYRAKIRDLLSMSLTAVRGSINAYAILELVEMIQQQMPVPTLPQERYAAVVAGLRQSLRYNMQEVRLSDEIFPLYYLSDSLRICRTLRVVEAHDVCCEAVVTAGAVIRTEREGPRIASLESFRRDLHSFLAVLPPEQTPVFWQMLKTPAVSEEFWPIVDQLRNRAAMPYLLDALPALSEEGKAHVVVTLQNIGDVRAVPALKALTLDRNALIAPLAESAMRHILRHSPADAAQLLRASVAQDGRDAENSLLRPIEATSNITRPEELLRPGGK